MKSKSSSSLKRIFEDIRKRLLEDHEFIQQQKQKKWKKEITEEQYKESIKENVDRLRKLDDVMVEMIDKDESLACIQDENGMNLGMLAARSYLTKTAMRCLTIEKSALQQDKKGNNIGMYAALKKLHHTTLLALENQKASVQQNKDGKNIGIIATESEMDEEVILKAIDNKEAVFQKDSHGWTIPLLSTHRKMINSIKKVMQYKEVLNERTKNGFSFIQGIILLENKEVLDELIQIVDIRTLLTRYKYYDSSIAYIEYFVEYNVLDYMDKWLKYKSVLKYVDENKKTIPMLIAENKDISKEKKEELLLIALEDKDASTIQDEEGNNLGMICAKEKLIEATKKAIENRKAIEQKNEDGETIIDIVKKNKLEIPEIERLQLKESFDAINNVYDEIFGK